MYRFDKEKLNKGEWNWKEKLFAGVSIDKQNHDILISGIEKAKKLYYKVGDNKVVVDLTGGARAVAEYRKRCAALGRM